ncbi:MAG: glutamine-hydrolyzing GMP synthase [Oscillospiraceae bacterium]|nr:glutamine-hydrolyzing GMP synthase [Oscillospiraceae bacterium]
MSQLVLVLDFGGQYKELIATTVRSLSVRSEIRQGDISADEVKRISPVGIILTGGPNSVNLQTSPKCDPELFNLNIPVLGICYGMQMICHMLGGEVVSADAGEYGCVLVTPSEYSGMLGVSGPFNALMSHRDSVSRLPDGFTATAYTDNCIAACQNTERRLYGVQFHPETKSTDGGREIIRRFLYDICGACGDYTLDDYIDIQVKQIRHIVGNNRALLALSGGVDSSVCAALLSKAIPGQLTCIFVDHGFMRQGEGDEIQGVFAKKNLNFIRVNAQDRFLAKIKGVTDPETKRRLIGEEFIRVFEEESAKQGDIPFLAQGTIYPDIVESGGGYGATIKSHHNVGGLPDNLSFTAIIEPLSGLFKDEVRRLGKKLGLPSKLVNRQPFPGPGLAIRIMGEVTAKKLDTIRNADAILREELDRRKNRPDQYFAVLTDTLTVGVKGDDRTYDPVVALRAVTTGDFMTCQYTPLPHRLLHRVSSRITSEISSVSRVVYDITSKPPGTVEWE